MTHTQRWIISCVLSIGFWWIVSRVENSSWDLESTIYFVFVTFSFILLFVVHITILSIICCELNVSAERNLCCVGMSDGTCFEYS